jgi:hypothetical protein
VVLQLPPGATAFKLTGFAAVVQEGVLVTVGQPQVNL